MMVFDLFLVIYGHLEWFFGCVHHCRLFANVQFVIGSECLHRYCAILCLFQIHLLLREIFAALHIRHVSMLHKIACGWGHLYFRLAPNARQSADPFFQIVVEVDTCIDLIFVPLGTGMELRIILIDCQEGIQRVPKSGFIFLLIHFVNKLVSLLDECLADFLLGRCSLCSFNILPCSFLLILKIFSGLFSQVTRQYLQLCL